MFGIQKDQKTFHPIRCHPDQNPERPQSRQKREQDMGNPRSRNEEDGQSDTEDQTERSRIRLLDDQESDQRKNGDEGNVPLEKIRIVLLLLFSRKPCRKIENNRELHHFRWLKREGAQFDPTGRTVYRRTDARNEHQNQ